MLISVALLWEQPNNFWIQPFNSQSIMVGIHMFSLDWFSCVIELSENFYSCNACYRSIVSVDFSVWSGSRYIKQQF